MEVGEPGVEHRRLVRVRRGQPAQQLALEQLAHRAGHRLGQRRPVLVAGVRVGDPAAREEHPPGAGQVADPQPPERAEHGPGTRLRQPVGQHPRHPFGQCLGRVQPQQVVEPPYEFAGPLGEHRQGRVRVAGPQGLLGAPGPGGRAQARAVDPYGLRVRGGGRPQSGAEPGPGGVGPAQDGEGERGARVALVPLEGVQDLRGALPGVGVAQDVLDEQPRIEGVQYGEQLAPQPARQGAQPRRRQQVRLASGPDGEQPQDVGGGGEPLGEQGPYSSRVRRSRSRVPSTRALVSRTGMASGSQSGAAGACARRTRASSVSWAESGVRRASSLPSAVTASAARSEPKASSRSGPPPGERRRAAATAAGTGRRGRSGGGRSGSPRSRPRPSRCGRRGGRRVRRGGRRRRSRTGRTAGPATAGAA